MDIRETLTTIRDTAAAQLAELPPPAPVSRTVRAGESLQAALDSGPLDIWLELGAVFEGDVVIRRTGTRLSGGAGSRLMGLATGLPALFIPPGTKDVQVDLPDVRTAGRQSVVQVGTNDARQTTLADVPDGIVLRVAVPSHRGKRAFEIHGTNVLLDGYALDVYDPAGQDNQAVYICNTPGKVTVRGHYQAGAEIILVGGDTARIAGVVPMALRLEWLLLDRPDSWLTDGVARKVKNAVELKAGRDVTLRQSTIRNNWADGQPGYAIVMTPKWGCSVEDVLVEDVELFNVGAMLNLSGSDDRAYTPPTRNIRFRRVKAHVNGALGPGRFAQWAGEPMNLVFDDCDFDGDTSTIFLTYGSNAYDGPTAPRRTDAYVTRGVQVVNSRFNATGYGFMLQGPTGAVAYGANLAVSWPEAVVRGNTFTGGKAAALKKYLPADNTFVTA